MMSKQLLWGLSALFILTLLTSFAFAPKAYAVTDCMDYSSRHVAACNAEFSYEAQWIYFNHPQVGEQKFQVQRVVRKSNNVVEHANFNFEGDCAVTNSCHIGHMEFINQYMDAFRERIVTEGLYIYRECDPTREVCCYDDGRCDQVHSVEDRLQNELANNSGSTNVVNLERGSNLYVELLKGFLGGLAGAIGAEVIQRATDDGLSDEAFREHLVDDSLFLIVEGNYGASVCHVLGNECQIIDGNLGSSGGHLQHNQGAEFNRELDRFLREWYESQNKICTQNMRCTPDGNCVVTLSCH